MRNIEQRVKLAMIAGVVGLMAGPVSQAAAKPLKVYILAGQSNMQGHAKKVLDDIKRVVPEYDPKQGYELTGFVWFQGFNDLVSGSTSARPWPHQRRFLSSRALWWRCRQLSFGMMNWKRCKDGWMHAGRRWMRQLPQRRTIHGKTIIRQILARCALVSVAAHFDGSGLAAEGAAEPALEDHVQRHMQPVTAEEAAGIAVGGTRFVGHGVADAQGAAGAGGDEPLGKHGKHGEADQANGESGQILVADKQRVAEE